VLAILALVALWRFTPPPRSLAAATTVSIHIHSEKAMAQIEIERDGAGRAHANVQVLDGAFRPLAAKAVTLVLANPAAGIEPLRREAARADGESNWRADDLRVPVAGRWNLRIEILITDFDKAMLDDTVTLPRLP
jgi:copper transport protein